MSLPPEASATQPLKALQAMVAAGRPEPGAPDRLLQALEEGDLVEHALALLRQLGAGPAWEPLRVRLKAAVAAGRDRRMLRWQTDPHRRTLRFLFEAAGPACRQHPPALAAQLAKTFLEAGLPLAMGLEKVPRPALHLGHPLPLNVPGRQEWADAAFTRALDIPLAELPVRINAHAPEGLRILEGREVPNIASPVADLCRAAQWRWHCPEALLPAALAKVEAFLGAERFELEKPGKTGGHKGVKRIEIRSLVTAMAWNGAALDFTTRIELGQAPNPQKLLGAILGQDPAALTGLERLGLVLAEDPRLLQAERYEPKLHNMYEDAVLLGASGHIRIIDDDDDAPLILGK